MAQINIKKNNSSSVSTPPVGIEAIFIADDGGLYTKNSFGTVSTIGGGGSGTSGSSGTSGVSGSSGSSGINGSGGSSGTSGINGNDGSSGTSGISGTSGTSPGGGASPIELLNTNQLVSTPIGATANSVADFSIAIGYNADAKNGYADADRGGIAIGKNSKSNGRESLAIGEGAYVTVGGGGVAIGNNAGGGSGGQDSCAIVGTNTIATSGYSSALGREARARGNWTVALGALSNAFGHASIVIGGQAGMATDVFSEGCILMGYGSFAAAQYSIGLGYGVKITADNAVAIGYGSTASHTGAELLKN